MSTPYEGLPATGFERLAAIARKLRAPDGCPWDREQTPLSLRPNIIEEAYELVEAINNQDRPHIREELGDLFLLPTMISVMFEEGGDFSLDEVFADISDKLIRRHPHVFGQASADTPEAVISQWNTIKEELEGRRPKDSALDAVKKGLPPLERAYRLQKAAAKLGFDWEASDGPWDKLAEELAEAREACQQLESMAKDSQNTQPERQEELHGRLEGEIGDLLFSLINVARRHRVDPAIALHRSMEKFATRFRHVEKRMRENGQDFGPDQLAVMDGYWDEAKRLEGGQQ